jgi:RNA polymerase sigma factor (sigma-70 family)
MDMPRDARTEDSDETLLAAYGAGDRRAARLLTERLAPRLLSVSARMLGDRAEAEDVVQEAMLRLWRAAPEWRAEGAKVSTWAYRVVSNLCIDRLRRARGVGLEAAAEPEDPAPGADERLQGAARARALEAALLELPPRQRQAVVLRHIEGLGNPEIAAVMDIGTEAVESLTARGKRALSRLLAGRRAELGFEDD